MVKSRNLNQNDQTSKFWLKILALGQTSGISRAI